MGNDRVGRLLECLLCNRGKLVKSDVLTSVLCNDRENLYVSMTLLFGVIRT